MTIEFKPRYKGTGAMKAIHVGIDARSVFTPRKRKEDKAKNKTKIAVREMLKNGVHQVQASTELSTARSARVSN